MGLVEPPLVKAGSFGVSISAKRVSDSQRTCSFCKVLMVLGLETD